MTHLIKEGITNIKEKGLIKTRKLHHTNVLFDDKYTTTKVLLGKERERERDNKLIFDHTNVLDDKYRTKKVLKGKERERQ